VGHSGGHSLFGLLRLVRGFSVGVEDCVVDGWVSEQLVLEDEECH
jgi:hypothetical protein